MPPYAATGTDIVQAINDKLRLDNDEDFGRAWLWVNGAISKIAIETGFFHGGADGPIFKGGEINQPLPVALVRLDYVTCTLTGGVPTRVLRQALTFDRILALRAQGFVSGAPRIYYLWQGSIEFWPTANGGEQLHYYGSLLPDVISGYDLCPLPEPFSKLVEYAALFEGAQFKKDPLVEEYRGLYAEWMNRFHAYLNQRRGRNGLQFTVRVMEEWWPPHDPSTDLLTWP